MARQKSAFVSYKPKTVRLPKQSKPMKTPKALQSDKPKATRSRGSGGGGKGY